MLLSTHAGRRDERIRAETTLRANEGVVVALSPSTSLTPRQAGEAGSALRSDVEAALASIAQGYFDLRDHRLDVADVGRALLGVRSERLGKLEAVERPALLFLVVM